MQRIARTTLVVTSLATAVATSAPHEFRYEASAVVDDRMLTPEIPAQGLTITVRKAADAVLPSGVHAAITLTGRGSLATPPGAPDDADTGFPDTGHALPGGDPWSEGIPVLSLYELDEPWDGTLPRNAHLLDSFQLDLPDTAERATFTLPFRTTLDTEAPNHLLVLMEGSAQIGIRVDVTATHGTSEPEGPGEFTLEIDH